MTSRTLGRTAGLLYIMVICAGLFAELGVRGQLIDYTSPARTADNILSRQAFYGLGIVSDLAMVACDLTMAAILYTLLSTWSRTGALIATVLRLIPDGMLAVKSLFAASVVPILSGRVPLETFTPGQREELALMMLRFHDQLYGLAMIFFGLNLLALGLLFLRSGLAPRGVGMLLIIGGLCDLVAKVPVLVDRSFAASIPDVVSFGPLLAELALTGWLLAIGWRTAEPGSRIAGPPPAD